MGHTTVQVIDTCAHFKQSDASDLDSSRGGNKCTLQGGKLADQNRPPIYRPLSKSTKLATKKTAKLAACCPAQNGNWMFYWSLVYSQLVVPGAPPKRGHPEDILTRCPNHLNWLLLMQKNINSTPSSPRMTNPYFPITHEQDPKILELLCLEQELFPQQEGAIHYFLAGSHGLRLRVADPHPDCFTLGSKPPQCLLEVTGRRSLQNHRICKAQ